MEPDAPVIVTVYLPDLRCLRARDPTEIVSCEVAAEPEGVTVSGANEHDAADGSPLQARFTAELNPFCGETVTVIVC